MSSIVNSRVRSAVNNLAAIGRQSQIVRPFTSLSTSSSSPSSKSPVNSIYGTTASSRVITTPHPNAFACYSTPNTSVLSNGLRVASQFVPGELATVVVTVDVGSRYETADNNGVAHFTEHLFFKGTNKRSRIQLEKEVEQMGASFDAHTSRETTTFVVTAFKKDIGHAVELLSDVLLNSRFDEDDAVRERSLIERENEEVNNDLHEVLLERLQETAYRGVALARPILGPVENIRRFTGKDCRQWVETHYTAPRMVVSCSGNVDHKDFVEHVTKHFGQVQSQSKHESLISCDPAAFLGSEIRVRFDSMPEAYVAYAFPVAGVADPDHPSLNVIQALLGGYNAQVQNQEHSPSPLVAELAKDNLANFVNPLNIPFKDTGLFGYTVVANKYNLYEIITAITQNMTALTYGVSEERVTEAKQGLALAYCAQFDNHRFVAEELGRQWINYGRIMPVREYMMRMMSVDKNAVQKTATRYFYDRDFALAAIGPIWDLPNYGWIRSQTYWSRF